MQTVELTHRNLIRLVSVDKVAANIKVQYLLWNGLGYMRQL
jgi:hypothetical protein